MKSNMFQQARIKLTLYYIAIMAVILFVFSSALLFPIKYKVRHGFVNRFPVHLEEGIPPQRAPDDDPVQNTIDEIEFFVYSVDALLLAVIGLSSYFLAGKTLAPIKAALDAQKKFSADASHDLRTPLAIMTTEAEVTLKNKNATIEDYRETIESNLEETNKMAKLVNDLLLISRGDNNATIHSYSEVDIHGFVTKIVDRISGVAEKKGLTVNVSQYQKILLKVNTNNFERAISNILQNAIKYTKVGSIKIDIFNNKDFVNIKIVDTGVGIGEGDLPHIFDRFFKAEHSRNDNSGSGLGLPIAKLIIEEHKGNIKITSKEGVGTTVDILLPLSA